MSNTPRLLAEWFMRFPGVGPKQAKRFVYFLAAQNAEVLREISALITRLPNEMSQCSECFRFASRNSSALCEICSSPTRDRTQILIVARDADLEAVEKSHTHLGTYFVLGGLLSPLDKDPQSTVRMRELYRLVGDRKQKGLREIIFALPANNEGDYTGIYIKDTLADHLADKTVRVTVLGRGLSTGTEIEYSDTETLQNALRNRIER